MQKCLVSQKKMWITFDVKIGNKLEKKSAQKRKKIKKRDILMQKKRN